MRNISRHPDYYRWPEWKRKLADKWVLMANDPNSAAWKLGRVLFTKDGKIGGKNDGWDA